MARALRSAFHGFAHLESGDGHPHPHDLEVSPGLVDLLMAGIRHLNEQENPDDPHDSSEAFVETMVANGVTTTFGIMGSAFMDAMDIFAPAGIELVPVVHEQGAAHMADGYARVSGKHGVVIGQNGPGISNCVTAVAAAFWAHSPVVMITPETGTMGQGLGGFQEANQLPMFQEFVKYQGHIANENRMAEITARCFDRAMSEIGPTQLNIPRDRFYGDIDVEIPAPMVLDRGAGGKASLDAAADMLAEAEFPVIVSGVVW